MSKSQSKAEYRRRNKDKIKEVKRAYYNRNKESILAKHKKYYSERKSEFRARAVIYKFGISLEEYNILLEKQNNLCAICGRPERSTRKGIVKSLAVDHEHETGRIRGLLCESCNTALGKVNDDIAILQRMIEYLG